MWFVGVYCIVIINYKNYQVMTKKAIGQRIKKEIDSRKWSVYKLGQESGITITQLQSMIKGNRNYTIDSYIAVSEALQINLSDTYIQNGS